MTYLIQLQRQLVAEYFATKELGLISDMIRIHNQLRLVIQAINSLSTSGASYGATGLTLNIKV